MFPVGNKAKVRKMFGFGVAAAFSQLLIVIIKTMNIFFVYTVW